MYCQRSENGYNPQLELSYMAYLAWSTALDNYDWYDWSVFEDPYYATGGLLTNTITENGCHFELDSTLSALSLMNCILFYFIYLFICRFYFIIAV